METKDPGADSLLSTVSRICLALPEVACERTSSHATYRVRKKVFAYFLDNHHGDGIVAVACKTAMGENEEMTRREPERFYLPAYIGVRGWVAMRLDRGEVDWPEVQALATASYCLAAPKKLAVAVAARSR